MLGLYFGDWGEDTDTAYVPIRRAKTERGARLVLRRELASLGYGDVRDYAYVGVVTEEMHDHACDDRCPDGPRCPRPRTVHKFEVA